ncbi:MAG: DUF4040 domain-containing protein [Pseudomonadota bacterium]
MEHLDELLINMVLLTLMAIVVVGIIVMKNLFSAVILSAIYSFLLASVLIVLDAVDVAMTEAAVGAGISTVLMLATLHITKDKEATFTHSIAIPLFVIVVTAGALIFATFDAPEFGSAAGPQHNHVAPYYLSQSINDTTVPNVVTAVLSSYRGFDTFGEVAVIFTAGIGIMLLLKGRPSNREDEQKDLDPQDNIEVKASKRDGEQQV